MCSCGSNAIGRKPEEQGTYYALRDNTDLPQSVRNHLPEDAQDIYRTAFNDAFAWHTNDVQREEIAHRIAWSAVKRSYLKVGANWNFKQQTRSSSQT
jgi:cation transport regulator